jgi:hypothetical protein
LPYPIAEDLLRSAGLTFSSSQTDRAYRFLLLEMRGASVEECNEILIPLKLPLLGSVEQDTPRA